MFSSMRPAAAAGHQILALVALIFSANTGVPATGLPPVRTAKPCGPPPAASITATPWPQERYDLSVLDQLAYGASVLVAVVDSGVDATNLQLSDAVITGSDLLDPAGDGRRDCV